MQSVQALETKGTETFMFTGEVQKAIVHLFMLFSRKRGGGGGGGGGGGWGGWDGYLGSVHLFGWIR